MKKLLLFTMALSFVFVSVAQKRALPPQEALSLTVKKERKAPVKDGAALNKQYKPGQKSMTMLDQSTLGVSTYDLQSNRSPQNRIWVYEDGTMAAVWTHDQDASGNSNNRGTGYNYFDGTEWGEMPTGKIEPYKTGWPSYSKYGENGEMFVVHHMTDGLAYGIRETKGEGDWTMAIQAGPTGAVDISWPRGTTSGENNEIIHFISVTYQDYLGQASCLLYSRSTDGGMSWDPENYNFDDLGPDEYYEVGGDCYDWAIPNADKLAFLVGDKWGLDLALMISDDEGESWDKSVVWESPYPVDPGMPTDTFYCADGTHHLAIDNDGLIHVAFGIQRIQIDDFTAGSYTNFPLVEGIVYWNENRPAFSSNVNALNPYGHPDSEVVEDYSYVGWMQDIDGDGEVTIVDPLNAAEYQSGFSSQPQLTIDDQNRIYLLYSSITETFVNAPGTQNYRHIWARGSADGGDTWGEFTDLQTDIIYYFDECVFPSVAPKVMDGKVYYYYQVDEEPGMAIQGDTDPVTNNNQRIMEVPVGVFFPVGVEENLEAFSTENVSQNFPNPFHGTSSVYVTLDKAAKLELSVTNMVGQTVFTIPAKEYPVGRQELVINADGFSSGVYFYTVKSGEKSVTRKMIVE